MFRPARKCLFKISPFFCLVVLLYVSYCINFKLARPLKGPSQRQRTPSNSSLSKDAQWQAVLGSNYKFLVYSAFLETRILEKKHFKQPPVVRVIGVTRYMKNYNGPRVIPSEKVVCRFWYGDESTETAPVRSLDVVNGTIEHIRENWLLKYSACFIYCPLRENQEVPSSVSIYSVQKDFEFKKGAEFVDLPATSNIVTVLDMRQEKGLGTKLAVCVKPIHFNYGKVWEVVEWIELNRQLGFEHFYFYNHTMAANTSCVLRDYVSRGLATVMDWKGLDFEFQKEIRTENMFAAINDCLYRTMYKHEHLAFLDFDEFLVPRLHKSLPELLDSLKDVNYTSVMFRNAFFYLQHHDDRDAGKTELITIRKTKRRTYLHKLRERSKYICKPDLAVEAGNHMLWEATFTMHNVGLEPFEGLLHHYRMCEFGGDDCIKSEAVLDRTTWKWNPGLESAVEAVQKRLKRKCKLSYLRL